MTPPKNVQAFNVPRQIMNDMVHRDKYTVKHGPTYTPTKDGFVEVKYPNGNSIKVSEYEAFIMQHIDDVDMFNENSKAKEKYQNMQEWLRHLDALDGDESDGITEENWNKFVSKYGFRKAGEFFLNIASGTTDKLPRELAKSEMTLNSKDSDLQLAASTLGNAYVQSKYIYKTRDMYLSLSPKNRVKYTYEEFEKLSWEDKSKLLRDNKQHGI